MGLNLGYVVNGESVGSASAAADLLLSGTPYGNNKKKDSTSENGGAVNEAAKKQAENVKVVTDEASEHAKEMSNAKESNGGNSALSGTLDWLGANKETAPNTDKGVVEKHSLNQQRDTLQKQYDELKTADTTSMTPDQLRERQIKMTDTSKQIKEISTTLGDGKLYQNGQERTDDFLSSFGKRTVGAYENAVSTLAKYAQQNEEKQRGKGVNDEEHMVWDTDGLTASNLNLQSRSDSFYKAMEKLGDKGKQNIRESSELMANVTKDLNPTQAFFVNAASTGLDVAADTALSMATFGGAGAVSMAARAFGMTAAESAENGDDIETQVAKGTTAAAIGVLTEKLGGGFEKAYGATLAKKLGSKVGQAAEKAVNANAAAIKTFIKSAGSEGFEEGLEDVLQIVADRLFKWDDGKGTILEKIAEDKDQIFQDMLMGGFVGMFGAAGQSVEARNAAIAQSVDAAINSVASPDESVSQPTTEAVNTEATATQQMPTENMAAPQTPADIMAEMANLTPSKAEAKANSKELIEKLKGSIESMSDDAPVKQLTGNEFPKSEKKLTEQVGDFFRSLGNKVFRQGLGDVILDNRGIKDDMAHGIGRAKSITFSAVPDVIANGRQIDYQPNWKGRGYDSYVFAAPVKIGDNTSYVAAVVLKDKTNRFYLHEVVDAEGNLIYRIENAPTDIKTGLPQSGITGTVEGVSEATASNANVAPQSGNVNTGIAILAEKAGIPQTAPQNASEPVNVPTNEMTPPAQQNTAQAANSELNTEPNANVGNEVERGYSENVRTDKSMDEAIRNSFETTPEMYTQLSNQTTLGKAQEIYGQGLEAARSQLEQAIGKAKSGYKLPPEMIPLSRMVANDLAKSGNLDAARSILTDVAAELTAAGQLGQAAAILRNADPITQGDAIQKLVDKLNNELTKSQLRKLGTDESGNQKLISVDQSLVESFITAPDVETKNAIMEQIEQNIADQIPATFRDKFTAMRYLNMLGNFKTQGRNIVGNAAMGVATLAKRKVQAAAELATAVLSGGKYERNTALVYNPKLYKEANSYFDKVIDEVKGETKYSDVSKQAFKGINEKRTIFDTKLLEGYRKATNWAMDVGDVIFMRFHYADSMAGYMAAHGFDSIESMSEADLEKAHQFAMKEAQEATFHDDNAVSDFVQNFDKGWGKGTIISQGIMPFRKTPANVAVRAIEYSPVGIVETVVKGVQAAKGKTDASEVINSAAKNATGSALAVAGYLLAMAGQARGSEDDDKLDAFEKLQGQSDYSVKIGNEWVSLSQFAPMAVPFFMGVKLQELLETKGLSLDNVTEILGCISDPMLEMSMLSGVNDALDNLSSNNGDSDALPAFAANAILGYLTQGLTNTLLGQIEGVFDENRQTQYTTKGSVLGKYEYDVAKATSKIPGYDMNTQDYVDAWGRTKSNGDIGDRVWNNLLNPTYASQDVSSKVDKELERLYADNKGTKDFPDVFPHKGSRNASIGKDADGNNITMTPDEYMQYSKDRGQQSLKLVSDFMDSREYKYMSDQQRAQTISDLYSLAADRAEKTVTDARGIKYAGSLDDIGNLKNPVEYISNHNMLNDIGSPDKRQNATREMYQAADKILATYDGMSADTKKLMQSKVTWLDEALYAKEALRMSSKDYFGYKDAIEKAQKAEGSKLNGATGALADAVVISTDFKNKSDAEKMSILRAMNQPTDGKPASIVRQVEYCMSREKSRGVKYSFDDAVKILAVYKAEYDGTEGEKRRAQTARANTLDAANVDFVTLRNMESTTSMNNAKYVNIVDTGKRDFSVSKTPADYLAYAGWGQSNDTTPQPPQPDKTYRSPYLNVDYFFGGN